MSAEIHLRDGGVVHINPLSIDGTVRIELHTDDGGMAACDFSPEDRRRLAAAMLSKLT